LVEVAADTDYRLGGFVGSGMAPAIGGQPNNIVVQQSGDVLLDVSDTTMGEELTSLKQLIMIPTKVRSRINQSVDAIWSLPYWHYTPLFTFATPMAATTQVPLCLSTQNVIARMFAYGTGGTSYNVYSDNPSTGLFLTYETSDGGVTTPALSDLRRRTPAAKPIVTCSNACGTIHAKVPSYQKTARIPMFASYTNPNITMLNTVSMTGVGNLYTGTLPSLGLRNADNLSPANITISYAASDDARCFCYIGPPPIITLQSTQSVPIDYESAVFG
jgi:hypothetical protein